MITQQQNYILKAISETTPISLSECRGAFLKLNSFDKLLLSIEGSCRTGIPLYIFCNSLENALYIPIPTKRKNIFKRLFNWIKSKLK